MEGLYESLSIENNASTSNNNQMIDSNENFSVSLFSEDELAPAYAQLFNGITNGNLGMVKQMLDFGLNVNYIYDKEQNYSFLHLACLMGHSKIIKLLLDHGAHINCVTSDGYQPIDFIDSDDLNILSYMLSKINSRK